MARLLTTATSQQAIKMAVSIILMFTLPRLMASRMAHWGAAALFAVSGFLIFGAALSVSVAVDVTTLYVFSIINSAGRVLLVVLVQSMPKLFLLELYDAGSEEMDVMLAASYAYQNMFRYGPLQFGFTIFLFYTAGEKDGPTTSVVLAITAALAALASAPLFWARLRNAMVKRSELLPPETSVRLAFERECGTHVAANVQLAYTCCESKPSQSMVLK